MQSMEYKMYNNIKIPQNLSPEKQAVVDEIARNYIKQDKIIKTDHMNNMARIALGSLVSGASFHPILNIPYVGTGLGGALYDAGQAIVEGDKLGDIAKRAGRGFAIGETVGAVPYVVKAASKTKAGQAVGKQFDKVAKEVAAKPAVQKAYDVLMTDVKAFNPNKQTVYHGSPYDFEKFSNEAIGTGEGAQAHGIGHYAAKNKDVASDYADRLTKAKEGESSTITYDNTPYEFKYGNDILENPEKPFLASVYANRGNYKDVVNQYLNQYNDALRQLDDPAHIEWLRAIGDKSDTEATRAGLQRARDFVNNFDINKLEQKTNKQLYKLSVPKDDVMLREDLPFSEQPKAVQKAIKEIINENPDLSDFIDTRTKEELFNITEKATGKNGKKIMKEIFDAELSGDENKISSAWDKWNDFEAKNNTYDSFDPNIIYGYLDNYKGKVLDDVDRIFTNKTSNTNLYKYLADENNFNKKLLDKGIKGISYNGGIDGEARVIFNPDDIDIVRKYYNQPNLKDIYNKFINSGTFAGAITNP